MAVGRQLLSVFSRTLNLPIRLATCILTSFSPVRDPPDSLLRAVQGLRCNYPFPLCRPSFERTTLRGINSTPFGVNLNYRNLGKRRDDSLPTDRTSRPAIR